MSFFGPSGPDPNLVAAARSFGDMVNAMHNQNQTDFSEFQNALTTLNSMWTPVIQSGVIPYGYSPGLDQLLQANVMQTGSQATSNAINAATLAFRQASGGAAVGPSGAQEAITAQIQATGQQQIARGLQAEKIAGYQQGMTNLEGASAAEEDIARQTGAAAASSASEEQAAAGGQAQAGEAIFNEEQASSGLSKLGQVANVAGKVIGDVTGIGNIAGMFRNVMSGAATPAQLSAQNLQFASNVGALTTQPTIGPQTVTAPPDLTAAGYGTAPTAGVAGGGGGASLFQP